MSEASIITAGGIANADAIVKAAAAVGLPTHILTAFAEHESNGANVFGHDGGGAYSGGGTVTQAKYNAFLSMVRAGHTSNGVGPLQITYPGYFKPVTAEVAGLWQPYNNLVFGAKIIKGYLGGNYSTSSLNRAGQIYNSGSATGAPAYGALTVTLCAKWAARLGTSAPTATYYDDLAHWFTTAQVKQLQTKVGTTADGVIGVNTLKAVQRAVGVTQDGVVGKATVTALQKKVGLTGKDVDGLLGKTTAAAAVKWAVATKPVTPTTPKGTTFPLPKGHAYAMNDGTAYTHSGVSKADQPAIKKIQTKVGVTADGIYGAKTKAAVVKAQKAKKVTADGEVGATTWAALGL